MPHNPRKKSIFMLLLFIVYLYILIKVILFKFGPVDLRMLGQQLLHVSERGDSIISRLRWSGNLVPFKTIQQNLDHLRSPTSFMNLVGNVLIFIPLGLFVRQGTKLGAWGTLALAGVVSLMLESCQLLFMIGTFDVDDILLNSFGGLLGYAVWHLAHGGRSSGRLVKLSGRGLGSK